LAARVRQLAPLLAGVDEALLKPPVNVLRLSLHGKAAGPHRSDGLRWPDNAALRGVASTSILADSCGSVVTIWG
jgi:hypothetical protein